MAHANATLQKNETLGSGGAYASHVGQAFFDQALITEVEKVEPYAGNTQSLTTNAQDSIMSEEAATEGVDPVMEYTLLGDSVEDGLFAWMAFGIDRTKSSSVSPAVYLTDKGGVANPNGGMGGGPGGGPGGPSGFPSGAFPSGFPSGVPSGVPPSGVPSGVPSSFATSVASSVSSVVTSSATSSATGGVPGGAQNGGQKGGQKGNQKGEQKGNQNGQQKGAQQGGCQPQ